MLGGTPPAAAITPPEIDVAALPDDGPPSPPEPMRQGSYCTRVATLPNTDYRVQPRFMDMLNLAEAWEFGRGGGVKVAIIDTGVTPHPRLPRLTGGGDYVVSGGDGLEDCDAHGTWVASLIAAMPADGRTPLPPASARERRPESVPTTEAPPPPPTPVTTIIEVPVPAPAEPPPAPPASWGGDDSAEPKVRLASWPVPLTPGGSGDAPAPPAPPAGPVPPEDAFSGVAPDVELISIRQSSRAYSPKDAFGDQDPETRRKAGDVGSMARAIVRAVNLGAQVINISQVSCMAAGEKIDQRALGAAVRWAAVEKNVVIVAAAGNTGAGGNSGCQQNPVYDPMSPSDPRDWNGVKTVVTPAWFSDYVLTVGAVDSSGNPLSELSMAGPWVSIAAPGTDVVSLSPRDDGLINATEGQNNTMVAPAGTSFSAAIVTGVVALVRARFPELTAHQVINRLLWTARSPARGIDNQVGHGVVDAVAALTWDVPAGEPLPPERLASPLELPPPPPGRDMVPVWVSLGGIAAVAVLCVVVSAASSVLRPERGRR